MRERAMQKLIGDKLEQMEIGRQEKMQSAPNIKIDAPHLKNRRCQIG